MGWGEATQPTEPARHPFTLTEVEAEALACSAQLGNLIAAVVGNGPCRPHDLAELLGALHTIQRAIGAQALARAEPDRFRLLGS